MSIKGELVALWRKLAGDNTKTASSIAEAIHGVAENITPMAAAAAQADSTAADAAGLKTDFNALLAKLRAAGLLETSS